MQSQLQSQRPTSICYDQDKLARSVKFHQVQNEREGRRREYEARSQTIGIEKSTDSCVAVDNSRKPNCHISSQAGTVLPVHAKTLPKPKEKQTAKPSNEARKGSSAATATRERPQSLAYYPRYAGRSMVLTATPDPVKRESVHLLSQSAVDAYQNPLGDPVSEAKNAHRSTAGMPKLATSNMRATDTSPTTYTFGGLRDSKSRSSANASQHPSIAHRALQRPEFDKVRRKTWAPKNVAPSTQSRNDSQGKLGTGNNSRKTNAVMDAVQYNSMQRASMMQLIIANDVAAISTELMEDDLPSGGSRPQTTAFEDFVVIDNAPIIIPNDEQGEVPVVYIAGERRVGISDWVQESDDENKESIFSRMSRRITRRRASYVVEEKGKVEDEKEDENKAARKDVMRGKQLAMRQKAIESSKKSKTGRKDWELLPSQRKSIVNFGVDPLASHPPEQTKSVIVEPRLAQLSIDKSTASSSKLNQSSSQLGLGLSPSPVQVYFPVGFSPDSSKRPRSRKRNNELDSPPKNQQDGFDPQLSRQSAIFAAEEPQEPTHPILRSQTEPLAVPAPRRNDLETLPSQRHSMIRAYTLPSSNVAQLPDEPAARQMDLRDRSISPDCSPQRRSQFRFDSAQLDSQDETLMPLRVPDKERRKSQLSLSDRPQSRRSERYVMIETPNQKSVVGAGVDKPMRPTTQHSLSTESIKSAKSSRGDLQHQRDASGSTGASSQRHLRPLSRVCTPNTTPTMRPVGSLVGFQTPPRVPDFELGHMTPESIDLLRKQEQMLHTMTATSSVVNVTVSPGIHVPFGITYGRASASTAPATPGDSTPVSDESGQRLRRKSMHDSGLKARRSRFMENAGAFASMPKIRNQSDNDTDNDDYDALMAMKQRSALAGVEKLRFGRKGVSTADLPDPYYDTGGRRKSRWRFWRKA